MFINRLEIKNYRLFPETTPFIVDNFNIPDRTNYGSGLNIFVGENACGKTSVLDALALPLLEYKTSSFGIEDINNPANKVEIKILSDKNFKVNKTMPKGSFEAKGFCFEGGRRSRATKAYLSSIVVSDQKFIPVDVNNPKEGSPDLRLNVNNPFSGRRFDENDILYLDKNRLFQVKSGTYNRTRFDRLMEDFSFQSLEKGPIEKVNELLETTFSGKFENSFLDQAISKFISATKQSISLEMISNFLPFKDSFFAFRKPNGQQIPINMLGSGLEMFFTFLYSFYLAQQSEKELIILIDEPELHFHPLLLETFSNIILEFSKFAQIIVTSHSPLFIKHIVSNDKVKIKILEQKETGIIISEMENMVLPFRSASEINFLAFNLATEEYHNELYEELKYLMGDDKDIKTFDSIFFINEKKEKQDSPWKGTPNSVSVHTYIRNQIHHQKDNGKPDTNQLFESIKKLRLFLSETNAASI